MAFFVQDMRESSFEGGSGDETFIGGSDAFQFL